LSHVDRQLGSTKTATTLSKSLKGQLALAMFRDVVASDVFYSVPTEAETESLDKALSKVGKAVVFECDGSGIGCDAEPEYATFGRHKFFRVCFKSISRQKIDKTDRAICFADGDMAVVPHRICKVDHANSTCMVEANPASWTSFPARPGEQLHILRGEDAEHVTAWTSCGLTVSPNFRVEGRLFTVRWASDVLLTVWGLFDLVPACVLRISGPQTCTVCSYIVGRSHMSNFTGMC
jgi:hypothetical protein